MEHFNRARLLMAVTKWDRKQSKTKFYNHYALAQYFAGIDGIMSAIEGGRPIPLALSDSFCGSMLRFLARELKLGVKFDKFDNVITEEKQALR
jgi:hypothetical protein